MKHMVFGLFQNSDRAGEAVGELKGKNYGDNISVVAQRHDEATPDVHQVSEETTDGTTAGAAVGAAMGALTGIIAGLTSVALPGVGTILVGGPLLAAWGLTGGAIGALTGGLVGALVDLGIPEETAKMYDDRIRAGEVLVAVDAEHDDETTVQQILQNHGAVETAMVHAGE